MSYSIFLKEPTTGKQVVFDNTQQIKDCSSEACLDFTYNYTRWYDKNGVFPNNKEGKGICSIYEMSGAESIPILENAIKMLENTISKDLTEQEIKDCADKGIGGYWVDTRVNATKPLYTLLEMAKMRPDALWDGAEELTRLI